MRYMMFVATAPDGEAYSVENDRITEWGDEVDARGVWIDGDRLRPADDATTVRRREGEVLVTRGAMGTSTESIVGYDVLECADLEEAIEIASRHPMARFGRLELRPFWPLE